MTLTHVTALFPTLYSLDITSPEINTLDIEKKQMIIEKISLSMLTENI